MVVSRIEDDPSWRERHAGFDIHHDEDGYWWRNGCHIEDGFSTLGEARRSIDGYNAEMLEEAQQLGLVPTDSPCLEPSWWSQR